MVHWRATTAHPHSGIVPYDMVMRRVLPAEHGDEPEEEIRDVFLERQAADLVEMISP